MAIKSIGSPSKITGLLRPPVLLELIGSDDFDTYEGWQTITESGTPSITAENSFLKISFTSAGNVAIGKKFNITADEMKHKSIYIKCRIQSYDTTFAFSVGLYKDDGTIDNGILLDTNETVGVWRIAIKRNGSISSGDTADSDVSVTVGTDYELILSVYKDYVALYVPDANGNYEALGKRWRRTCYYIGDLTNVVGQNATLVIYLGTNDSAEAWVDIVELYECGGEGLKDPEILAVWENGLRKAYRDTDGYYYVMVQLSATPTNNVERGNGKLAIFRTTDLKDPSKYEYFMTIFKEHKVSGDMIVYNDTVIILYSDFSTGSLQGVGRARMPLSDFLNKVLDNMVDEGIIVSTSTITGARDSKFFQDPDGNWHIVITGDDDFYVGDMSDPLSTISNIRAISGWHEYPPYSEHPGVLGITSDGKILAWASSSGGNDALKLGNVDLQANSFTDTNDPWYSDPDYDISEAYDLAIVGNEVVGVYQSCIEALPSESGWIMLILSAPVELAVGAGAFSITGYPSSISASPGATITINVTVVNNGDADGTVEVRVRDHNNSIVASKQVAIAAGGSESISLTATAPSSPGTYSWKVEAYNVDTGSVDDSKSFTVEVSGLFGGIDIQQMMQLFMQLLPFIMMLLLLSIIVAALR